jgi:ATP-dependent Clp protease ATP-binding subunit ClpA
MTLTGVAPEFVEALRVRRQALGRLSIRSPRLGSSKQAEAICVRPPITSWSADCALVEWAEREGPLAAEARWILNEAETAASSLGHDHIGTEHLLLALRVVKPTLAAFALKLVDLEPDHVRDAIRKMAVGSVAVSKPAGTPRLQATIRAGFHIANEYREAALDGAHLLLALLHDRENLAFQLLQDLSVDTELLDNAMIRRLPRARTKPEADTRFYQRAETRLRNSVKPQAEGD